MADPYVVVLFGATGDLSKRKLLPGLLHLFQSGLVPKLRIVGTSMEQYDQESFTQFAREAVDRFSGHPPSDETWAAFTSVLRFVPGKEGPDALRATVVAAEDDLGADARRLHYLSVPPQAALAVVATIEAAELVTRAR